MPQSIPFLPACKSRRAGTLGATLLTMLAALGLGYGWAGAAMPALPLLAAELGASPLTSTGLSLTLLTGLLAWQLARAASPSPPSPGQSALATGLTIASLAPGIGIGAMLPVAVAALWLWLGERRPLSEWFARRRIPSAANDNAAPGRSHIAFADAPPGSSRRGVA